MVQLYNRESVILRAVISASGIGEDWLIRQVHTMIIPEAEVIVACSERGGLTRITVGQGRVTRNLPHGRTASAPSFTWQPTAEVGVRAPRRGAHDWHGVHSWRLPGGPSG